jgi:ParB family transcriptional regulator, chromosome partitioning protein
MNYIETFTTQPQLIEIAKLEKSPLNVRKTLTKAGIDEMKASILSHGLMQNLVVSPSANGTYLVIAGSRRLAALHSLQAEGKLAADFAVPCQIVSEHHAREMSLAENTVRLAMHPADQFEAFAKLIDEGQTAAQVADRFGVEESLIVKRMKLARVAPELFKAYRKDEMTLECLMAFTITDNRKQQLKVYKSLQNWQKDDPRHIRACLTEKMVDATDKLVGFVGLDAYTASGGTIRSDLFGEDAYLEKPALLHRLANAKLDGIRKELEAEGWGWIDINPERDWNFINQCGRIQPMLIDPPQELVDFKKRLDAEMQELEQAFQETESDETLDRQEAVRRNLDEVEEKLVAFVGFDPERKKLAGCCISIAHDGTPFIDKGLVKPEHKKQLSRLQRTDDGTPATAMQKDRLPETLRRDLAAYRLQAAQVEIARHPAIAIDLLTFHAVRQTFATLRDSGGLDVQFNTPKPAPVIQQQTTQAGDDIKAIKAALPLDWMQQPTEVQQFDAFRTLADAEKQSLLAFCVAMTLKPSLAPAEGEHATAFDAALSLTGASVAAYWRPTKPNYFGRVTRDQLLAIGRDVLGEVWANAAWKDKKGYLADQLERDFSTPDIQGRIPEQAEKLKRWLPARMEFGTITAEAKPAKAKKARKAA